jgi:hypothetical protein
LAPRGKPWLPMRLLLDEQFPLDFIQAFGADTALHVHTLWWAGIKNGELMRRASGVCDVFLTLDRSLPFQQNVKAAPFGSIVVRATSNRIDVLVPLVESILECARQVRAGEVLQAGA